MISWKKEYSSFLGPRSIFLDEMVFHQNANFSNYMALIGKCYDNSRCIVWLPLITDIDITYKLKINYFLRTKKLLFCSEQSKCSTNFFSFSNI